MSDPEGPPLREVIFQQETPPRSVGTPAGPTDVAQDPLRQVLRVVGGRRPVGRTAGGHNTMHRRMLPEVNCAEQGRFRLAVHPGRDAHEGLRTTRCESSGTI